MIKAEDGAAFSTSLSGAKKAACWHREPNTPAVRFETLEGNVFVFPYQHLTFVRMEDCDGENRLTVVFVSHEVTIHGRQLFPLLKALQGFSLEWVCTLPQHHVEMLKDAAGAIRKIVIRELVEMGKALV